MCVAQNKELKDGHDSLQTVTGIYLISTKEYLTFELSLYRPVLICLLINLLTHIEQFPYMYIIHID